MLAAGVSFSMLKEYDDVVIKYNGDIVSFGQCYDKLTGKITHIYSDRYCIMLDKKSELKIKEINKRTNASWTHSPAIPFKYVFLNNKNFGLELE